MPGPRTAGRPACGPSLPAGSTVRSRSHWDADDGPEGAPDGSGRSGTPEGAEGAPEGAEGAPDGADPDGGRGTESSPGPGMPEATAAAFTGFEALADRGGVE